MSQVAAAIRWTLLTLAVVLLAACARHSHRPPCPPGALCLAYGNGAEPTTFDPAHIDGIWEANIVNQLIVGLVSTDAHGEPQPALAKSWDVSPDGLAWTFHLRDADWSDGVPVTAGDFVFALRRVLDPKTASHSAFLVFPFIKNAEAVNSGKLPVTAAGIEAPDPHTVVLRLSHPWPLMPYYAGGRFLLPVPEHVVARWGEKWSRPEHFVGDGPYTLVSWKLGDAVIVKKNPRYYDARTVCFGQVLFNPSSELISNERSVKAGDLDYSGVQSNRVRHLQSSKDMASYVHVAPQFGTYYLSFNIQDPLLKDVRVRQALSMAIDRDFLTNKLMHAGQKPSYSLVPQGMPGYDNGPQTYWASWSLDRRQAEARRLLAAAGYGPAHPLKITFKHLNSPDPTLIAPSIQADWKAVGVDAQLRQEDVAVAYSDMEIHDYQVGIAGWVGGVDPFGYLDMLRVDGGQNYGGYVNPKYDAAIDVALDTIDPAQRAQHLRDAETMLLADAAVAPLYFASSRSLVNPQITGWLNNKFDTHPIDHLCRAPSIDRQGAGSRAS